jgi:hypothetical protein
VGLYGTCYVPAYDAIYPQNPRARYLQAEGALDAILPETVAECVARAVGTSACSG